MLLLLLCGVCFVCCVLLFRLFGGLVALCLWLGLGCLGWMGLVVEFLVGVLRCVCFEFSVLVDALWLLC